MAKPTRSKARFYTRLYEQTGVGVFKTFERTTWMLVAANLFGLIIALIAKASIATIMWAYWCESIVIGCYAVRKMLMGKGYAFGMGIVLSIFFVFHYGAFHLGYVIFILVMFGHPTWWTLLLFILLFISHYYSYKKWKKAKREYEEVFVQTQMIAPYRRILPMHITIVASAFILQKTAFTNAIILVLFVILKTAADTYSHQKEHGLI